MNEERNNLGSYSCRVGAGTSLVSRHHFSLFFAHTPPHPYPVSTVLYFSYLFLYFPVFFFASTFHLSTSTSPSRSSESPRLHLSPPPLDRFYVPGTIHVPSTSQAATGKRRVDEGVERADPSRPSGGLATPPSVRGGRRRRRRRPPKDRIIPRP